VATLAAGRARAGLVVGAALVLVTLNLRFPLVAVSPVLDDVRAGLGLSSSTAGLLTTLPVLCFGVMAPLAPVLSRRIGQEVLLLLCLLTALAGVALRLVPEVAPFFAGTLVLGVGIAIANILLPSVIKRRFAEPGPMMGVYSASLSVAAVLAGGLTVPLEHALGDWRWAIGAWGLATLLACVAWLPYARGAERGPTPNAAHDGRLRRDPIAWRVTGTFALQSFLFYAFLAWMPEILRDAGMSDGHAGAYLSLATLCAIPASLTVPVLAARRERQSGLAALAGITWLAGLAGLLVDPAGATWLWMLLVGVGQGVGISLGLTLVVLRSPDGAHAAALSGMTQGVGYVLAATAPFALGALHDATGGWQASLWVMVAMALGLLACGWLAGRPGMVGERPG
jgi:CP family cyanate transporter-like MFS transporter